MFILERLNNSKRKKLFLLAIVGFVTIIWTVFIAAWRFLPGLPGSDGLWWKLSTVEGTVMPQTVQKACSREGEACAVFLAVITPFELAAFRWEPQVSSRTCNIIRPTARLGEKRPSFAPVRATPHRPHFKCSSFPTTVAPVQVALGVGCRNSRSPRFLFLLLEFRP